MLEAFQTHLKKLRSEVPLSQEVLADRASLDRTYISLLERGKRNPSLRCLVKIADALGVPLSQLCSFRSEDV